jgi:hypothetical protein
MTKNTYQATRKSVLSNVVKIFVNLQDLQEKQLQPSGVNESECQNKDN